MTYDKCPNCSKPFKGIFSAVLVSQSRTDFINKNTNSNKDGYCNVCSVAPLEEIAKNYQAQKSVIEKRLIQIIHFVPVLTSPATISWQYEAIDMVTSQTTSGTGFTQKAKEVLNQESEINDRGNTALIDGVRKFTMDVRELDVDWIDSINPFSEAYSILSKAMTEKSLKAMADIISGKKLSLSLDEARDLTRRAVKFKKERGRLPDIKSADPWEQRMAQGIAFLARLKAEERNG